MELTAEDSQFLALLEEKRHKEIIKSLSELSAIISKQGKVSDIESAIKESSLVNSKSISMLMKSISEMPKPDAPEVNVHVRQEEIVKSIQDICNKIVASNDRVISALEERRAAEFKIERDGYGNIRTVKVIYKNN